MSRLKLVLRVGGLLAAAIGVLCLPIGYGVSPKRDLSVFSNLADMGAFIKAAFVLIPFGVIALVVSRFLPGDAEEW
jgi:hypothetical protein